MSSKSSEIARYVGDRPEGPFRFKDITLRGTGSDTWDRFSPSNPEVRRIGDVYFLHSLANLERPQLLFDDSGMPVCLYAAAGEQDPFKGTPSFNLAIPVLREPVPAKPAVAPRAK